MVAHIIQPEFGQRLRNLRCERGLSQRDLAVGAINQSYVSLLESGARVPTLEVVLHLARVLDVQLDALVDDVELITSNDDGKARNDLLVQRLLTSGAIAAGHFTEAEEQLTQAYQAARASGPPTAILTHGLELEQVLAMRDDNPARYALLRELLDVAVEVDLPEALVRVHIDLGSAARETGHLAEALDHTEAGLRLITKTAFWRGSEHVRLIAVHISALSDSGGGTEVSRFIDSMLDMAREIDSPAISGRTHWVAGVALARLGEIERSLEHLRMAGGILANPSTSLRDWAHFCRAAVSALMDADGDRDETTTRMIAARAAGTATAQSPRDTALLASLEVRYAVACGNAEHAIDLATAVDETALDGLELVRFIVAMGRALRLTGRTAEAMSALKRAAALAEDASAYRRASQIWREATDLTEAR